MIQTLDKTENFIVQYEDAFVNAKRRAEQLLTTCESDFHVLKIWFGINDNYGFGFSNLVTIRIESDPDPKKKALGRNYGYHDNRSSLIRIDPLDVIPVTQDEADDAVQCIFVAEMIEILMDYRNKKKKNISWHPGESDGEGLSRVAAATLHPVGYYKVLSVCVNSWLVSDRGDTRFSYNEPNDTDVKSFGFAVLFIYYMRDQLHHSLSDIIQYGGHTLEETYNNLTGLTDGLTPFTALLDKYLPYEAGNPKRQMKNLVSDNPFPIWEGYDRMVGLKFIEKIVPDTPSVHRRPVKLTVTVRPFFTCPEAKYRYYQRNLTSHIRCIASTEGFAQPVFSWRVNGLQAFPGDPIAPTVSITVDQAAHPDEPTNKSAVAHIQWDKEIYDASTFSEMIGELDVYNLPGNHLGHEHLTVEVTVKENFGSNDSITIANGTTLDTSDIRYENQFYLDRFKCIAHFEQQIDRYNLQEIPPIFKVPKPDPPEWMKGIRALRGIADELVKVREGDQNLAAQLTDHLARLFQIPVQVFSVLVEESIKNSNFNDAKSASGNKTSGDSESV